MEPNIVFVYKIETHRYLTLTDVHEMGEWQTFELNLRDEFDTFNHHKYKQLEGRGYFIGQEDLHNMVNEINKCIQENRKFSGLQGKKDTKDCPFHLVVSESLAGSVRVGLERPKMVIGFPDFLSIGPLWNLDDKNGQSHRSEWLYENINFEEEDHEYENKYANAIREIEDIPIQVPIYIWYGDNIEEQIGLRFLLNLLKEKTNDIYLVNSTKLYKMYILLNEQEEKIFHTGQIEMESMQLLLNKATSHPPLSASERLQFQGEWKELTETEEVLRIWSENEIKGVSEDYYDSTILKMINELHQVQESKEFIKAVRVLGEILDKMNGLVNIFYLEYRIRHLIYTGVLELKGIPKSMRHYSIKMR